MDFLYTVDWAPMNGNYGMPYTWQPNSSCQADHRIGEGQRKGPYTEKRMTRKSNPKGDI